ncbi:MAG: T9SS type A sorting domain-containing protein, partial [Candidatus Thorarchaeota archaeon]
VPEGSTTPVTGWLGIYSTNAPANYSVEYLHPPIFSSLPDSTGTTNGILYFEADPTGLSGGVYFDTMLVWVDGVANNPRRAIATLIVQYPAGDSLYLTPNLVEFSVPDGSTTPVIVNSWLSSTNSPMNFTGYLDTSSALWMTLIDDSGVTDQNVSVSVDPTGFSTGVYYGHVFFQSPDADNTAMLTIKMTVGSGSATAWATPDELVLQADVGSTTPVQQSIDLQSSNAPAGFIGWSMNASALDFVTLPDSAGMTNANIPILADPTGLEVGNYADTVIFMVNDVENPVLVVVNLAITSGQAAEKDLTNYPNPFNPSTNIIFYLDAPSHVKLLVYNVTGQVVATLVDRYLEAGEYSFPFDGSGYSSGVYFYRLQTETVAETRKMILLK